MTSAAILVFAAVMGLVVGSFLNVCIYRIPRNQSLAFPPSRCPRCGTRLAWFDNIPLASWIVLGGKCRQCGESISIQYPLVEVVTAIVAVTVVMFTPPGVLLASRLTLAALLIVLFVIDLELQILPNVITLPGIVVGFAFSFFAPPGPFASLAGIALGAGILYGIALAYYAIRKEEGMGMGDVKMLAMIGAFLGWRAVLLTLLLSSFAGALIGVLLMIGKREGLRYALPFGTFLALGALVAMLAGDAILAWYLGLFEAV